MKSLLPETSLLKVLFSIDEIEIGKFLFVRVKDEVM